MSPSPTAEDALRQSLLASHVRGLSRTSGPVGEVAFSPDGRLLAFADAEGAVSVRETATGTELFAREVGAGGGASFSPDGASVVLHGKTSPPVQVAATTGAVECVLDGERRPAADATVAGAYAVVVRNGQGYIWSRAGCRLLQTVPGVGRTAVSVVASVDGSRVAFVSGREAQIVRVPSGDVALRLEQPSPITSLAFDRDAETIVTGGRDSLGRVWSGVTGRLRRVLRGHTGYVLDVAIEPEGALAATVSTDGTGRVWDVVNRHGLRDPLRAHELRSGGRLQPRRRVDRHREPGRHGADVGDQRETTRRPRGPHGRGARRPLLARRHDGRHGRGGRHRANLGRGDGRRPREGRPRPAGSRGAGGHEPGRRRERTIDGKLVVLERADGTTSELAGHTRLVTSVAFSPDGRRLVTASRDRNAILWDVASGKPLRVLRAHFNAVNDARFSPDGRWILTAGPRSVGLWRSSTGELVRLLRGPPGPFTAVSFSPDSRTIVAASGNGVVSSYDCRLCGEIPELLELAEERLATTGRDLTPEERELYVR